MENTLSGSTKEQFDKAKRWWFVFLNDEQRLYLIMLWFNTETNVKIDIHSNDTYFDWYVRHPFKNEVYTSNRDVNKNPFRNHFECLKEAINKADSVFNRLN